MDQPINRTEILEERANRDAFRLAIAILAVFALFLAALIVVAVRVQVIAITLPERVPAVKNSSSSAGRTFAPARSPAQALTSCAAAANRSKLSPSALSSQLSPLSDFLHAPSPAAGEKENPSGMRTADRRGGGVGFIYHPKHDEAAGASTRLFRSGHLAMAVSASPVGPHCFTVYRFTASPILRGLDSAASGHPSANGTLRGGARSAAPQESPRRRARSPKGPRSRDWEPSDVRCLVSHCPCHRNGRCILPSQIEIGPDGRCRKASEFKPKPPAPVSGD